MVLWSRLERRRAAGNNNIDRIHHGRSEKLHERSLVIFKRVDISGYSACAMGGEDGEGRVGGGAGHHCNQTTLPLQGLAQVVIADPAEVLCVCWCAEGLVGTASLCRGFGSGHFPFNNIVCQIRARSWSKIFHHNMHPRPAPSPTDQHEEHFAPGSQCSRHAWRFGLP